MRLWSVHPKYLDSKGLLALWRESLLAKCVLEGKTKGYKNHPQLFRFKIQPDPIASINYYLEEIFLESQKRKYFFDRSKIGDWENSKKINLPRGQLDYEKLHLHKKLLIRDATKAHLLESEPQLKPHPIFKICSGKIESWEKI